MKSGKTSVIEKPAYHPEFPVFEYPHLTTALGTIGCLDLGFGSSEIAENIRQISNNHGISATKLSQESLGILLL